MSELYVIIISVDKSAYIYTLCSTGDKRKIKLIEKIKIMEDFKRKHVPPTPPKKNEKIILQLLEVSLKFFCVFSKQLNNNICLLYKV